MAYQRPLGHVLRLHAGLGVGIENGSPMITSEGVARRAADDQLSAVRKTGGTSPEHSVCEVLTVALLSVSQRPRC